MAHNWAAGTSARPQREEARDRGRLSIWTMDLSPTVQLGGLTMLDRYQDQLAPGPERRDWVPPCGTYERLDNPCRPALIAACEGPRSISHSVWGGA